MVVCNRGTKCRLEGSEIWANFGSGVIVADRGDPTLAGCTIRDHVGGGPWISRCCGVRVASDAAGMATVGADCVFARNAGGDVVRDEGPGRW